jgi:hypothetical protein
MKSQNDWTRTKLLILLQEVFLKKDKPFSSSVEKLTQAEALCWKVNAQKAIEN